MKICKHNANLKHGKWCVVRLVKNYTFLYFKCHIWFFFDSLFWVWGQKWPMAFLSSHFAYYISRHLINCNLNISNDDVHWIELPSFVSICSSNEVWKSKYVQRCLAMKRPRIDPIAHHSLKWTRMWCLRAIDGNSPKTKSPT